jgi:hypothetical protein
MAKKLTQKEKRKRFEAREVYKKKGLSKKLTPTGYEAYRVSPRTTIKHGKRYRKIYGAVVEPDYKRKAKGKNRYGAKVKWFPHGYTTTSVKGGTRTLQNLRYYPVNVKEARGKLMLKKRKARKAVMKKRKRKK